MRFNYKKVNKVGGINIPVAIRREMNIQHGDAFEVVDDSSGNLILKPHNPRCVFCSTTEKVFVYHGRGICNKCVDEIRVKTR